MTGNAVAAKRGRDDGASNCRKTKTIDAGGNVAGLRSEDFHKAGECRAQAEEMTVPSGPDPNAMWIVAGALIALGAFLILSAIFGWF